MSVCTLTLTDSCNKIKEINLCEQCCKETRDKLFDQLLEWKSFEIKELN